MGQGPGSRLRRGCAGLATLCSPGLWGQQGWGPGHSYTLVARRRGISWARVLSEEQSAWVELVAGSLAFIFLLQEWLFL